jgi:ADP-ribose pyrophosphatase YjhB (NUDIX family)
MQEFTQRIAMKAVVQNQSGEVLIVRIADTPKAGPNAGKYGLPGGKLKAGEVWDEGLRREVKEETGLDVTILKPLHVGEWRPVVQGVNLQIVGVFFACAAKDFTVTLSEENDAYEWVSLASFEQFEILEPDRTAALNYLKSL